MGSAESSDHEINLWLDRLADYNLAPTDRKLTAEDLLKVIGEIWNDQVSSEEMDILRQILLTTENLVEGQLRQEEWVDRMNQCFDSVRDKI
jgi:hypothetical protein